MSRATPDEERLVSRAAAGDEAAFAALVRSVRPRLRRWALARMGDPDEADEVVQDTLVRIHQALRGFSGASRFSSWAYRILANVANQRYRAGGRRPAIAMEELTTEPDSAVARPDSPDPVARLHARRMAAVVLEYFETLPPRQREVLELVDHEGMRPIDVADLLDMKPVTVRAHLFKARRAIRSRILERYPELMEGYER